MSSTEFYNTVGETGERLRTLIQNGETQSEIIKDLFQNGFRGTALELIDALRSMRIDLVESSVRRAVCNLYTKGVLHRDGEKIERRGVKSFIFKIA